MSTFKDIKPDFEIIAADGIRIGHVDKVAGDRIKLQKHETDNDKEPVRYISEMLVASVHDGIVRLSANSDVAISMEEPS